MIDEQIENVMNGNLLSEIEIKSLCERVKSLIRLKKYYQKNQMFNRYQVRLQYAEMFMGNSLI
jgi:hypothetical protein